MHLRQDTVIEGGSRVADKVNIEEVVDKIGGAFSAAIVVARRAREIQDYYSSLGSGAGGFIPPQVLSLSRRPLSVALEEILADKVVMRVVEDSSEDASPPETSG